MELILKCSEPGDRLDEKLTKSAVRQLPRIADPFTPKHRPATAGDRTERNCSVASRCLV